MKRIALFAVLSFAAGFALAQTCDTEIKAIDAALPAKAKDLDEQTLNKVRNLRTKGESFCKAGKQSDGLATLGRAKELLGIK
jgi:hypothetical protein